jgi:hypothetical protein
LLGRLAFARTVGLLPNRNMGCPRTLQKGCALALAGVVKERFTQPI